MEVHRIRKAKALYDKEKYHVFLEVEKNRWLEIESLNGVSYDSIQTFLESEKETGIRIVGFTDQNFQWGTIKDWSHSGIIKNLKSKKNNYSEVKYGISKFRADGCKGLTPLFWNRLFCRSVAGKRMCSDDESCD